MGEAVFPALLERIGKLPAPRPHVILVTAHGNERLAVEAIKALGEGPAPRRGPGTHPAKMADQLKAHDDPDPAVRRLPPE